MSVNLDFIKYLGWAAIQQCLILLPFYFLMPHDWYTVVFAVLTFSFVAHAGNTLLAVLTFILSAATYPVFFLSSWMFIYSIVIIHAISGTILKQRGVEMRVWRFNK